MRNAVAVAAVLLSTPAAHAGPPPAPLVLPDLKPADPRPYLPPLGCRHRFPPYPWCVEQEAAAHAFADKCERILRGGLGPKARGRWEALQLQAERSRVLWDWLMRARDPVNGGSEGYRRQLLRYLYVELGPDAFFAGRMPLPIPDDAPRD